MPAGQVGDDTFEATLLDEPPKAQSMLAGCGYDADFSWRLRCKRVSSLELRAENPSPKRRNATNEDKDVEAALRSCLALSRTGVASLRDMTVYQPSNSGFDQRVLALASPSNIPGLVGHKLRPVADFGIQSGIRRNVTRGGRRQGLCRQGHSQRSCKPCFIKHLQSIFADSVMAISGA